MLRHKAAEAAGIAMDSLAMDLDDSLITYRRNGKKNSTFQCKICGRKCISR